MAEDVSPVWGWSQSVGDECGLAGIQEVGQIQERKTQRLGKGKRDSEPNKRRGQFLCRR